MNLNVRELLMGNLTKLRYINRFSGFRVGHLESVAEHSFYTTLYAMVIAAWCIEDGTPIHQTALLRSALLHDAEEGITGDMPRPFKHGSPDLASVMDQAVQVSMHEAFSKLCPSSTHHSFFNDWHAAKSDSNEGRILEFADFLSVLAYLSQEYGQGNRLLLPHVNTMNGYFETFRSPMYTFIHPLVIQAQILLRDLMEGVPSEAGGQD